MSPLGKHEDVPPSIHTFLSAALDLPTDEASNSFQQKSSATLRDLENSNELEPVRIVKKKAVGKSPNKSGLRASSKKV